MLKWLAKNNFVEEAHDNYTSGWCDIPICRATDKLKQRIIEVCK